MHPSYEALCALSQVVPKALSSSRLFGTGQGVCYSFPSDTSLWALCGLGSCVELNRSAFLEPEGLSKARKSVFITRKLTVSVGEAVNGGPLPPVPHHTPVCSFNTQNKYVGESLTAELPVGPPRPSVDAAGK